MMNMEEITSVTSKNFLLTVEIKDYNAMIDDKIFFD